MCGVLLASGLILSAYLYASTYLPDLLNCSRLGTDANGKIVCKVSAITPSAGDLLLESGDGLLLESGDQLQLE
jgi:hypothetical protein